MSGVCFMYDKEDHFKHDHKGVTGPSLYHEVQIWYNSHILRFWHTQICYVTMQHNYSGLITQLEACNAVWLMHQLLNWTSVAQFKPRFWMLL